MAGLDSPDPAAAPPILYDQHVAVLARSARWARFLGVVGLAVTGLMALTTLVLLLARRSLGGADLAGAGATIPMAIGAGVYGTLCWRYGSGLRAFERGQTAGLARAFRSLRFIWVVSAIALALSPLLVISTLLGYPPQPKVGAQARPPVTGGAAP